MLRFDPVMQEAALAAFGARHGPDAGLHDAERMFALYAKVGPAMWQAIERDREAQAKASFTLTTR